MEKKIPNHVGLIMDGNRRWAKERNLNTLEGHSKGYEIMRKAGEWFFSRGVKFLTVYAFSTENWNRSQEEVNYLMKLLKIAIEQETDSANKKGYRVLVSGRIDELPGDLPQSCRNLMDITKDNKLGTFNICLNYGGRAEIIDAIKKIYSNNIELEQIHEGLIGKYLYNSDVPDLDMVVRTSGENRISGFMLWRASYSEFIFMKKYWPEFEESDADLIINEYANRNRRFGGE